MISFPINVELSNVWIRLEMASGQTVDHRVRRLAARGGKGPGTVMVLLASPEGYPSRPAEWRWVYEASLVEKPEQPPPFVVVDWKKYTRAAHLARTRQQEAPEPGEAAWLRGFLRRLYRRRTGSAVFYSMVLAQTVGLLKAEATIQAALHIADPWILRMVVYGVLGLVLSGLVAWANVRLVRRLTQ